MDALVVERVIGFVHRLPNMPLERISLVHSASIGL